MMLLIKGEEKDSSIGEDSLALGVECPFTVTGRKAENVVSGSCKKGDVVM